MFISWILSKIFYREVELLRRELNDKLMKLDDQEFEISQLRQQRAALNSVLDERDKILKELHVSNCEKRRWEASCFLLCGIEGFFVIESYRKNNYGHGKLSLKKI